MNAADSGEEWRRHRFLPLVAGLGYTTSVIHMFSMGPFFGPLQEEFGWSRAQIASGFTLANLLTSFLCIPMGMLVDKVGPRCVAIYGVTAVTFAYALLGTATGTYWNWLFLWALIAFGAIAVQPPVWTSAVISRFEASRGIALAITLSGGSIAAAVSPILSAWLIEVLGWRTAFAVLGIGWLSLVAPVVFVGFRGASDNGKRSESRTDPKSRAGIPLAQAIRSPALYWMMLASFLYGAAIIGLIVHFVPLLKDRSVSSLEAASVASIIGLVSIIGRLSTGFLLDRFDARFIGAIGCALPITACTLFLATPDSSVNWLSAVLLGLALGAEVDVIAYMASRRFGTRNFGALYGAMVMMLGAGAAVGPLVAGAIHDNTGSYLGFLWLAIGVLAGGVSCFLLLAKELTRAPRDNDP